MTTKTTTEEPQPSTEAITVRRLDPQALLESAIVKESPVDVIERLVALVERVRAQDAKEAWLAAMATFQERCPVILKNKMAGFRSSKGGNVGYAWATLDQLLGEMQPIAGPLGLSFSFQQKQEDNAAFATCRISHEMGHSEESGWVKMPITFNDGTAASPQQQVGKAFTYAKRYALLAISGIAPEDNPDLTVAATPVSGDAQPAARVAGEIWIGKILNVKSKSGTSKTTGKPWTKYVLQTSDAQEFETFDKKHADFAKEAGSSRVEIAWEQDQYGKNVLTIGPAEAEADARD